MINKEKIAKLNKYIDSLKERLSLNTPSKHKDHPDSYKQFLVREIALAQIKLDQLSVN